VKGYIRGILEGTLERLLEHMAYATKREQALALELAQVKDQLGIFRAMADERLALLTASAALADERAALLAGASTLAEERVALLAAAAARAEKAEAELSLERRERDLAAKRTVGLELRVEALKRRRKRQEAEVGKLQDQLARADVSGRVRELQEEKAKLKQRVADLQTYFSFRIDPPTTANLAEDEQGSANSR